MSRIPFFVHDLGAAEVDAFATALRSPILTTGETVAGFERRFANYLGMPEAVGMSSCTGALHLTLTALGVGAGDEVVTTPMTFVATATAIVQAGARPVFVDVEADTGNLDARRIEAALTPRTKAIVPVHLFGRRTTLAARYRAHLTDVGGVTTPLVHPNVRRAWHIFAIWVDGTTRDAVVAGLEHAVVGVTVNYRPVHLTTYFRRTLVYAPGAFPIAERIADTTISLPLYASMPEAHVDEVVARLAPVLARCGAGT